MTSTPVREVGSILTGQTAVMAGKSAANTVSFQKVWGNQMSKGAESSFAHGSGKQEGSARVSASSVSGKRESSVDNGQEVQSRDSAEAVAEKQSAQSDETTVSEAEENVSSVENASEEVSDSANEPESVSEELPDSVNELDSVSEELVPEELTQAMEVLCTAAMELMQQIADAFGITMEELQSVMDGLGMEQTDVLKANQLSNLVLELGGAEDSCALLMDETLCDNYRMLMGQLENVLQESAGELEMEPEQLVSFLEKFSAHDTVTETAEMPDENVQVRTEQEKPGIIVETAEEVPEQIPNVQTEKQSGQMQEKSQDGKAEKDHQEMAAEHHARAGQFQPGQFQAGQLQTSFRAETAQAGSVQEQSGWSAQTQDIMNQIMDHMKIQLQADTTNLEMQLHPAHLGSLQVQIVSRGGVLTAHFITQNETVKEALESQIVQLRDNFEEQGIKVEAVEVTVQSHAFEQNLEQGRDGSQQEPEKKSRIRKINLNDPLTMEDLEEEDALAADLMAANGSTVDYTA